MKLKFLNFIKKSDILGKSISFEEENNKIFKTVLGGLLTIFLIVTMVILSYYFGKEIWERKKPTTFINEQKVSEVDYEITEFPFLFAISNNNFGPLEGNIFSTFDIGIQTVKISHGIDSYSLFLIQNYCDITQFPPKFHGQLELILLLANKNGLNLLCIPVKEKLKSISKSTKNLESTNLILKVNLCKDSDKFNVNYTTIEKPQEKCSIEEISKVSNFLLHIFFLNNFVDIAKQENPIEVDRVWRTIRLDKNFKVQMDFFITSNELKSDSGWIIEDVTNFRAITIDEIQFQLTKNYDESNIFVANFQATNSLKVIYRRYLKIQELLATIGGLFNGLLICINILFYDYSNFKYYKEFAFYELQVKEKMFESKITLSQKLITRNNISSNFNDIIKTNVKKEIEEEQNLNNNESDKNQYQNNFSLKNETNKINKVNNFVSQEDEPENPRLSTISKDAEKINKEPEIKKSLFSQNIKITPQKEKIISKNYLSLEQAYNIIEEIKHLEKELEQFHYSKYFFNRYIRCCSKNKHASLEIITSKQSIEKFSIFRNIFKSSKLKVKTMINLFDYFR